MLHKMNLQPGPYRRIKDRTKIIEMRLYDEKRQKINIGDIIEFTNNSTKETLEAKVLNLHRYKTFAELYAQFEKEKLGYDSDDIAKPEDMEQYYSKEKIQEFGVVGIEIEVIR